ncbi:MAG: glycine zipper 2TM domain-containing protein [Candidatus Omnitrophica bacterium]|nr:glycine zipper 2TM domain-containing protein [Candidatus Omnitrophota bacterium]
MRYYILVLICGVIFFPGCTATQKGAGAGALIGGGVGYAIGHQSGHGAEGAGIGAAVGAVGGALIGNQMEEKVYCPVCGRQFKSSVQYCPYDGTALKRAE